MLKIILLTILGLALTFLGVFLAYPHFNANGLVSKDVSVLVLPGILLFSGLIVLLLAGRSNSTVSIQKYKDSENHKKRREQSLVEQNSEISREWTEAEENEKKLKTLRVAMSTIENDDEFL